ncbi:hypothetical protein L1D56_07445 [Vibrio diabolicus]|uniref:hypothetical protein n=1 Tax=Vibrio diabolicus TaxID=50719 RepID=UPI00211ABFF1|nr:hypothetical protein [Vibrio diabolicus]MCG9619814.1 hypothetical protein [Vibrio diabolicus]
MAGRNLLSQSQTGSNSDSTKQGRNLFAQNEPTSTENSVQSLDSGSKTTGDVSWIDRTLERFSPKSDIYQALELGNVTGRDAFQRGLAQGSTFGFADEASGSVRAAVNKILGNEDTFSKGYQKARDVSRATDQKLKQLHPAMYTAGEITGSIASAVPAVPQASVGMGRNLARLAGVGAVEGGLGGLGSSEADLVEGHYSDAATDTGIGAAIGGIASPVIGGAIDGVLRIAQRIPALGLTRLQGDEAQRARNNLTKYLYQEVNAGRINPQQVANELQELQQGSGAGVEFSLADLDAFQGLVASVNRQAGNPVPQARNLVDQPNPTPNTGMGFSSIDGSGIDSNGQINVGTITEQLSNRQKIQQEAIAETFNPSRRVTPETGNIREQQTSFFGEENLPRSTSVPSADGERRFIEERELTPNKLRAMQEPSNIGPKQSTGVEDDPTQGVLNIPQVQENMRKDLNQYTEELYAIAKGTPVQPSKVLSADVRGNPAFRSAWSIGSKKAREANPKATNFEKLDMTKRELDSRIRKGENHLIDVRDQLVQELRTISPEYGQALDVQSAYRQQVINQFDNAANYFNLDEASAYRMLESVQAGDMEIASEAIGQQIRKNLRTARTTEGELLTPEQITNYERLLNDTKRGESRLRKMISAEARTERTKKLADVTTGRGIGPEAENALRDALGADDLAVGTVLAALSNPSVVAVPWMINRGIASTSAKVSTEKMFRELQRELYAGISGSNKEVRKHLDNIFSFNFEKVPSDVIRQFINTLIVGGSTSGSGQDMLDIQRN